MSEVKQMLLGKELVFSKEMDLFNSLRKKYLMLSVEARKEAEEAYDEKLSGYNAVSTEISFGNFPISYSGLFILQFLLLCLLQPRFVVLGSLG